TFVALPGRGPSAARLFAALVGRYGVVVSGTVIAIRVHASALRCVAAGRGGHAVRVAAGRGGRAVRVAAGVVASPIPRGRGNFARRRTLRVRAAAAVRVGEADVHELVVVEAFPVSTARAAESTLETCAVAIDEVVRIIADRTGRLRGGTGDAFDGFGLVVAESQVGEAHLLELGFGQVLPLRAARTCGAAAFFGRATRAGHEIPVVVADGAAAELVGAFDRGRGGGGSVGERREKTEKPKRASFHARHECMNRTA